jgi:hypothetical protein
VGVLLEAAGSLLDVVDVGHLRQLPGTSISRQFLGHVIADPNGTSSGEAARDLLRGMCDYALHLDDFDSVPAFLGSATSTTAQPSGEP